MVDDGCWWVDLIEVSLEILWPNLEVFFHGGISFKPYKNQYKDIIGKDIRYYEIYNASEGFFAIQDQNNSNELLLMLDYGIFYEFLPIENLDDEYYDMDNEYNIQTGAVSDCMVVSPPNNIDCINGVCTIID